MRIHYYYFSSTSDHASNSQLQDEATSISELPGYVGPSASNVEVDAAENARGVILFLYPYNAVFSSEGGLKQ